MEKAGVNNRTVLILPYLPAKAAENEKRWQVSWLMANATCPAFPSFVRTVTRAMEAIYSCGAASASNGIPFSPRDLNGAPMLSQNRIISTKQYIV